MSMRQSEKRAAVLSAEEKAYLAMGLKQAGGKLPLFDTNGQEISRRTIKTCIEKGYAERWFVNPLKPDWLVCRLTATGRNIASFG